MTATAALTGYGTLLQISDGASAPSTVYTSIAEVTKITGVKLSRGTVEATHLLSPGRWKEFIVALKECVEFNCELSYVPVDATQKDLLTNLAADAGSAFRGVRVVLPDFGAVVATISGVNTSTGVITTGTHGWLTGQSVQFANSGGALPTGLSAATTYYLKVLSTTTFTVHPTPADAAAATNKITPSGAGSGTNTVRGGTVWAFNAATSGFAIDPSPADVLKGSVSFRPTSAAALSP